LAQLWIFPQSSVQKTLGSPTGAPQRLSLYPTAEVGHTASDLDQAAVTVSNGV
jgi:hypothetical protein